MQVQGTSCNIFDMNDRIGCQARLFCTSGLIQGYGNLNCEVFKHGMQYSKLLFGTLGLKNIQSLDNHLFIGHKKVKFESSKFTT